MQAGDLVFVRGNSPISYLVRLFDKGKFSHIAVAVSPTHIIEAEYSTKVRISKMEYEDFEIVDLGLTKEQRDAITHEAIQCVGQWYDYLQILGYVFSPKTFWGSPNSFICSELAYKLLNSVGIKIGNEFTKPNEMYNLLKDYKKSYA